MPQELGQQLVYRQSGDVTVVIQHKDKWCRYLVQLVDQAAAQDWQWRKPGDVQQVQDFLLNETSLISWAWQVSAAQGIDVRKTRPFRCLECYEFQARSVAKSIKAQQWCL